MDGLKYVVDTAHKEDIKYDQGVKTRHVSLTSTSKTLTTADKISKMMLAGVMLEANDIGYDFRSDQDLPDVWRVPEPTFANAMERMEFCEMIEERMMDHVDELRYKSVSEMGEQPAADVSTVTPSDSEVVSPAGSAASEAPPAS